LISPDSEESEKNKAREEAINLLEKAIEDSPWDWYAKYLLNDITTLKLEKLPAVVHADRINWHATHKNFELMEKELKKRSITSKIINLHFTIFLLIKKSSVTTTKAKKH
jgi:hypothetical protein